MSFYSVVRYVPSSLAEEFVNVGVVSFGDGKVRGRFLENWSRVERFADLKSLTHAREFQEWVEGSMVEGGLSDARMKPIDEATVLRISTEWHGSVQLSEPRGSLLTADELLENVAPIFLMSRPPARSAVVTSARSSAMHLPRCGRRSLSLLATHIYQFRAVCHYRRVCGPDYSTSSSRTGRPGTPCSASTSTSRMPRGRWIRLTSSPSQSRT